jgi:hypothetical protein
MATRTRSGSGNLAAAMTLLIQNQAQLVSEMVDLNRRYNELKEETARRLANIEALLIQHDQLLKHLPDAIKEKIGFKN